MKNCIILWYHVPPTCITTYLKLLSPYPFISVSVSKWFNFNISSFSCSSMIASDAQAQGSDKCELFDPSLIEPNVSHSPRWSNQHERFMFRSVMQASAKIKKDQKGVPLTPPFACLFDRSPIPMLSTAHPFVNHHTLKWKVFNQKKINAAVLFWWWVSWWFSVSYSFPQKESFIPFLIGILRPTNLNTQSSPDQPCKSTKISTNRGSRPCFCSENILQPPLPCSKLTHPAEECRSMGISWQNDNLAGQLLGFEVMRSWICVAYINMVILQLNFLGVRPPSTKVSSPTMIHLFPPKSSCEATKQPRLMVPQKATWWASFANCVKNCLTYLYWTLTTKILQ